MDMHSKPLPGEPIRIEAVKYRFRTSPFYTKVTESTGRVIHYGPWNSRLAAQLLADAFIKYPRRH